MTDRVIGGAALGLFKRDADSSCADLGTSSEERRVTETLSDLDWDIRLFIYRDFVDRGAPPSVDDAAERFDISIDEARASFQRLHRGHAIFLEPETDHVRMANPLSAIPTPYRVTVNGQSLYANCAWDSVGVPAMLRRNAQIEARVSDSESIRYSIENGALIADTALVVHFPIPFSHWYDDLIHT